MLQPRDNVKVFNADDITVYCSHLYYKEAVKNINGYLKDLNNFFHRKQLFPSPSKCSVILLSTSHSDWKEDLDVVLGPDRIKTVNDLTLLRFHVEHSLTFKNHMKDAIGRASKRNNTLQFLTPKSCGLRKEQRTTVYKAITRYTFTYAAQCCSLNVSKTNLNKLECKQNEALRVITGCTKWPKFTIFGEKPEFSP